MKPALLVLLAGAISFQQTSLNCARESCEITLTKIVTLSGKGHAELVGSLPLLVQDRAGRFFVRGANRRQVIAFDSAGRFLSVMEPPDQAARSVALFAGVRGSVLAWAAPTGKTYSIGDDLKLVPSPSAAPYGPGFVRADGSSIVAQPIDSMNLLSPPLHVLAPDRRVVRAFGLDTPRANLPLFVERVIAPASDGSVWAVPRGRYTIERWDPETGTRLAQVPVRSDWFVESGKYPADGRERPKPIIEALWERDGLLWVLMRDADRDWRASTERERVWELSLYNSLYDWALEVVDPASGTVLVSKRFESALWGRSPQAFVVSFAPTKPGEPADLEVWKPELRRKQP